VSSLLFSLLVLRFRSSSALLCSLLNYAISRLPASAEYVAWVDGDVEFPSRSWVSEAMSLLDRYAVVQLFEQLTTLGPKGEKHATHWSFGYSVMHKKLIDRNKYHVWFPHPGKKQHKSVDGLEDGALLTMLRATAARVFFV
jgi:hypothetical protein